MISTSTHDSFSLTLVALLSLNFIAARPQTGRLPRRLQSSSDKASSNVYYDNNWAGAVLNGTNVTSVSAQLLVGTAMMPKGGSASTKYSSTSWVGIDGTVACDSFALLQTGVTSYIENGKVIYEAWYEWSPDPYTAFDGFVVNFGDKINMTVTAMSSTSGVALIQNLSTGKSISHTFTGEEALCQNSAEWVVENFGTYLEQYPFANFTTVNFTDTKAVLGGKNIVGSTGSEIYGIEQDSKIRTKCSTPSSSAVTCTFVE